MSHNIRALATNQMYNLGIKRKSNTVFNMAAKFCFFAFWQRPLSGKIVWFTT